MKITEVKTLQSLSATEVDTAVETYQQAFAAIPYLELFSTKQAQVALSFILEKDGDLIFGENNEEVVSLAGGYMDGDTYCIEELAVRPGQQGQKIGRETLSYLLNMGSRRGPKRFMLRTNVDNKKALNLYESVGFQRLPTTITVPKQRIGGMFAVDERVYLLKGEPMKDNDMLKRVIIAYPSGNTTALVFDQRLDDDRSILTKSIMSAYRGQAIEQCGFITLPKDPRAIGRLQMFGDEFCGNGGRSAVWAITGGQNCSGLVEVSGVDKPLNFTVENGSVTLEMPLPDKKTSMIQLVTEGTLVRLEGIAQLVVTNPSLQTPRDLLTKLFDSNRYGLANELAFGVTYYDQATNRAKFCVKVAGNDTIFDETACGSGTCAIGVALADRYQQTQDLVVTQPSGESIFTKAIYMSGAIQSSSITGEVKVLYDGPLNI